MSSVKDLSVEDLELWTDKESLSHHAVCSQFKLNYLKDPMNDESCQDEALTRVRGTNQIIRTLLVHSVRNEGDQYSTSPCESKDQTRVLIGLSVHIRSSGSPLELVRRSQPCPRSIAAYLLVMPVRILSASFALL